MSVLQKRWREVDTLFTRALEVAPAQRIAFLERSCGGDDELLTTILSLLQTLETSERFLETPAELLGDSLGSLLDDEADVNGDPFIGQPLGAYRIVRLLGRGGNGSVYLGERVDGAFEQHVAIKLLRRGLDTEDVLIRFRTERQILATLDHPNIARLLDGGATPDGRPYIIMEHVQGTPIAEYCDMLRLPLKARLELFTAVADAVSHAHQRLIVHRDLKPSNILVTDAGVPKLLDFGIAKLLDTPAGSELTRTAVQPMTPEFASPEQLRGGVITTGTDVYQLGALLYLLMCGRRPFEKEDGSGGHVQLRAAAERAALPVAPSQRVVRLSETAPAAPSASQVLAARSSDARRLQRALRGDIDAIVLTALDDEPRRRYASASALGDDVQRVLDGRPVRARSQGAGYRALRWARRNPAVAASLAAALLLSGGYMTSLRTYAAVADAERDRARLEEQRAAAVSSFLVDVFSGSHLDAGQRTDTVSARTLLAAGVRRIEVDLMDQPDIRSTLLVAIGQAYSSLGGTDGVRLVEQALQVREELYGAGDPRTIGTLEQYAGLRLKARHGSAALAAYEDAHARRLAQQPQDPARIAGTLRGQALALRDLEQADSALVLLRRSLEMRASTPEAGTTEYAQDLIDVGFMLRSAGDLDAAEAAYASALPLLKGAPDAATSYRQGLNNYAYLLRVREDFAAAEPLYREALELSRAELGPENPTTQMVLGNLGALLQAQKRYPEAEAIIVERIEVARRHWGSDSWQVATQLGELGVLRLESGDASGAEDIFRDAARMQTHVLGAEHSYTANARAWIGRSLAAQGRRAEAERELRTALALLEASSHDAARRWKPQVEAALREVETPAAP
jgi:eukaryotic-like serine/threonine-protein kinase